MTLLPRSHSEVLGVASSAYEFGREEGTTQSITVVMGKISRENRGDGDRSLVSRVINDIFLEHIGLDPGLGN